MNIFTPITHWYTQAKQNKWYRWFVIFCRIALALGFIPSGFVKLAGERFTALPHNHPLGQYFDSLHQTGFYYTSIGIGQLLAALLLLIPRTALLGALLYFPIIVNICILTYATRFEGTRITTFMVLGNLFLLVWYADRLKYLFLSKHDINAIEKKPSANKFPFMFFGGVIVTLVLVVIVNQNIYNIRPGNSLEECTNGCAGNPGACEFCDCIYNQGKGLDSCLKMYEAVRKGGN